jgi:hypothetical protein
MKSYVSLAALVASAAFASSAVAGVSLIANGQLTGSSAGSYTDLSGLNDTLENGVSDSLLGGLGSGMAYAGGHKFIAVPDRGPNAVPFNSNIDDTASYINRFQTVHMTLKKSAPGSTLPLDLTTELTKTTLLYSPTALNYGSGVGLGDKIDGVTPIGSGAPGINTSSKFYYTGRSDNYGTGTSGNFADARFDPESIRISPDGKTAFISDEYGPYIREFNAQTGKLIANIALPSSGASNVYVSNLSPMGATEISGNTSGRVANKGMEGLALTPDGKTLVAMIQAPLEQDAANTATKKLLRIYTIDVATGTVTHVYGYNLTTGSGVSEILAINDHQFLVDERDGNGLGNGNAAAVKQFFEIDLNGATDITNLSGSAASSAAVSKTLFLNMVTALNDKGITSDQIPAKIEGMAFGQDVMVDGQLTHTLWVSNDNDFVQNVAGPNQFYVFGFTDNDLPGYSAEAIAGVPEPGAWAMMLFGLGMIGAGLRTARRKGASAFAN